ncbi:hypothetical protein C8A00DRAFT_19743 [Chaetomidium leptoderma]|uniref:Uncharacterized protein n=1 Tax=Chaetomidium leptoderma TaxID=669021 RepID=A0AAN6VCI9_9PEZI|nr:hypothetical protein C8A00DRAFT_19743 [Chaetomidium leptoderma]
MLPSLRLAVLAALLIVPYASVAAVVSDGPNKLDECTACGPIYKTMAKCQQIKRPGGVGKEIMECICVPNPDGWYPYIHQCRDCLSPGNNDFFGNLASMMTQLLTSCTNPGGNVFSDGESICATNAMWSLCASLKDGSGSDGELSWASFDKSSDPSQNSNATQLLNIRVPNLESSTSSESAASKTTATTAALNPATTAAASETTTTTAATGTGSQAPSTASQSTTATDNPSSAACLRDGSQAGYVMGMLIVAGVIGLAV